MHLNIPNTLTWFRIAAIPLVAVVFYIPWEWARPLACLIFTLAAVTDILDGYFARRLGQTSRFGAFLDPVADKLMVITALILVLQSDPRILIAVVAGIIVGREIAVSALREWMAEQGARDRVAVSGQGKFKTIMQMVGLGCMIFFQDFLFLPVYDIGLACLIVAAGLTLWSMFGYLRSAWPELTGAGKAP